MFSSTNRLVLVCGTVVLLSIIGVITYLVAIGKLSGNDALNVIFGILGALGVGGAAHVTATVANRSNG